MQIFEIFNCVNGQTQGYRVGLIRAKQTVERIPSYVQNGKRVVLDYIPATDGFYVLDMRANVKAGPFETRDEAQRHADFENQSTDLNSFHVVDWRN